MDESTGLLDLFALVLVKGTRRLRRRGLDRGYLPREEEIPGVRGKLLVTQTLRRNLLRHGRTASEWDELEYDTLPNRILKSTLRSLRNAELKPEIHDNVNDILRWLSPVQAINLRGECFRRVQLHRNNRIYRFLLHVCEFIYEYGLPTEQGSGRQFRDFVRDRLWKLFQDFVHNFYQHHLPAGWHVKRSDIKWQMDQQNEDARKLVPIMKTDMCLDCPDRAIILDTKYYEQALKGGDFGSAKLNPSNLYQLFAYLRQRAAEPAAEPRWKQAEGVLLYPRTTQDFSVDFTTYGHRIRALTLDLAQPKWETIHERLLQIVNVAAAK